MSRKIKLLFSIGFISIQLVLLISILATSGKLNNILSFSSVVCSFMFSLIFISLKNNKYLTQIALLFTVVSDIFLVLIQPQNQAVAMTTFSVVQILYFVRIWCETKNKKLNLINLIVRVCLIIIVEIITIIIVKENVDYVSIISMFYYTNLILNLIFSFINFKISPLLAIGLVFFLLCDTFVGFSSAINVYFAISESSWIYKLVFSSFNFIWFFYVPSQTLLALSTVNFKQQKN